jgi:hypothetical protein
MPAWLLKDNEARKLRRFHCNTEDPHTALRSYLQWLNPDLTKKEIESIAYDFNGEIWAEKDVENVGVGKTL